MTFLFSNTTEPYYYWTESSFGTFVAYDGAFVSPENTNVTSFTSSGVTYTRGTLQQTTTTQFGGTSYSYSVSAEGTNAASPSITSVSPSNSAFSTEGDTVTYNVVTSNFPSGTTQLNWAINNVGTTNSDFNGVTGTVDITNNSGSFTITSSTDTVSEPTETYRVTVSGTVNSYFISAQSGEMSLLEVTDGSGGTSSDSTSDERDMPAGAGTGYGLEINNENQTLIISSKVDVILNKQELSFSATATGGGSTQIQIPNVSDPTQFGYGLFPQGSSGNITTSVSGNTITINNQSSFDTSFNIEIFRLA
jgi:hypothetical protein